METVIVPGGPELPGDETFRGQERSIFFAVEGKTSQITGRREEAVQDAAQARFELFVRCYSADIFRYAITLSRNRTLAEDLVQETFLRAWRRLETLREDAKAKSWLMTTVRREYLRYLQRLRGDFESCDTNELAALDTSASVPGTSDEEVVHEAIMALPGIHRDVLALQVLGGFSGAEIGQMLGIPRATVNTRLFRARQNLKRRLREAETPAPRSLGKGAR